MSEVMAMLYSASAMASLFFFIIFAIPIKNLYICSVQLTINKLTPIKLWKYTYDLIGL